MTDDRKSMNRVKSLRIVWNTKKAKRFNMNIEHWAQTPLYIFRRLLCITALYYLTARNEPEKNIRFEWRVANEFYTCFALWSLACYIEQ